MMKDSGAAHSSILLAMGALCPCTHAAGRVAGEGRRGVVGHALHVEDSPTILSQKKGRHGHQPISTSQCCMRENGIAGAGVVMGPDYKGCGQASPTCCQGGRSRRTPVQVARYNHMHNIVAAISTSLNQSTAGGRQPLCPASAPPLGCW